MDIKNKSCLIIGDGEIAQRKTEALLKAGAKVKILTNNNHKITKEITPFINNVQCHIICENYEKSHLAELALIISTIEDNNTNTSIFRDASKLNIPVNVVDKPEFCSFIFPAIVERGPITIGIGSNGNAPVLARLIRSRIETIVPVRFGTLAALGKKYRNKVKETVSSTLGRRRFWESVFQGKIAQAVFAGKAEVAEEMLKEQLTHYSGNTKQHQGEVYLVGAGPGDPELLTLKALRLLQQADIIVYDRLVSDDILNLARRDASKIYVGKKSRFHSLPQDQINQLIIDHAKQGKRVLRLKGGDPFIFGRGGEEAEELVAANIPFQVVPGITSAAGASSYLGIPLTHRDYSQSVSFVTGHLKNDSCNLNWKSLSQKNQTLVIYMGISTINTICTKLIQHDMAKNTPVAIIQNATLKDQRIVIGKLSNIEQKTIESGIVSPALIVIGEVVKLYSKLNTNKDGGKPGDINDNILLDKKTA